PAPGSTEGAPLRLLVPVQWLAVALVFLTGFRIGLNLTNSNVIDVGYAGVIGADKITHLSALWGHFPSDNPHGDTYRPLTYLAHGARRVRRARRDGEVRAAGARAALHRPPPAPPRAGGDPGLRGGGRGRPGVRGRLRRPTHVLRSHHLLPGLARLAVLDLGP